MDRQHFKRSGGLCLAWKARHTVVDTIVLHLDHYVKSQQVLDSSLLMVIEVQFSDILILKLVKEGLQAPLVQCIDWNLGHRYDILAQVSHWGLSRIVPSFQIKEDAVNLLGILLVLQTLLVLLDAHGRERPRLQMSWRTAIVLRLVDKLRSSAPRRRSVVVVSLDAPI